MATRLTDRQKKQILAELIEGVSIRALAKKYGVSTTTIQRIKKSDTELAQKVTLKKEQNTIDILQHMESKKDLVCELIDEYLLWLMDPKKLKASTLSQISTALGTVIDKFTKIGAVDGQSAEEAHNDLISAIKRAAHED